MSSLRVALAVLILGLLPGCAPTVPLAEHHALELRLEQQIAELRETQDALRTEMKQLEDTNQELTAMVAAQRMIIRDLRCRPSVTLEAE